MDDLSELADAPAVPVPRTADTPGLPGRRSWTSEAMYAVPVQELIDELGRLPGIGPKSAQRIAFYILKSPGRGRRPLGVLDQCGQDQSHLVPAVLQRRRGRRGSRMRLSAPTLAATRPSCAWWKSRATSWLSRRPGEFRGRYHVLLGAISPIDGIGPAQLRIRELLGRLESEGVKEVILCTNPNIEGDATASVPGGPAQGSRGQGDPHRQWAPRRRRPRVRRRAHAGPGSGGQARGWLTGRHDPHRQADQGIHRHRFPRRRRTRPGRRRPARSSGCWAQRGREDHDGGDVDHPGNARRRAPPSSAASTWSPTPALAKQLLGVVSQQNTLDRQLTCLGEPLLPRAAVRDPGPAQPSHGRRAA